MPSGVGITIFMMIVYTLFIVGIGWWSTKYAKKSLEDYAMASRELRVWVLFGSVFGANISAVTLIGIPGTAYHAGWVAWPYFVSAWAWGTPFLFYVLGGRAYVVAQKFGYMTISEMVAGRWKSSRLAYVIAAFLVLYTVPYLMTGLMGGAVTLSEITKGFIPYWLGGLLVTLVVLYYLLAGGLRGAAWVNTFQTAIFLIGGVLIFLIVAYALGGPGKATAGLMEGGYTHLLDRSKMSWQQFWSYGVIVTFAVTLFPQVFMRILAGKNPRALKQMASIYPLGGAIIFFVMAYCGMWGKQVFPDLVGSGSDSIMPMLLAHFASPWVVGLLGAAVFAALMSTIDSQLMAASTIIVKDFLMKKKNAPSSEEAVKITKIFVVILAIVGYVLALWKLAGIIKTIEFAFAGFALNWIPLFGALYWKRCTEAAAFWAVVISQFFLIFLTLGWIPKSLAFGFLPGIPAMVVGVIILVVVTYLTPAPSAEANEYIDIIRRAFQSKKDSSVAM